MNGPEAGVHIIKSYTHQTSSQSQIHCAINLYTNYFFDAAITLALAAEDQLPDTTNPHAYSAIKAVSEDLAKTSNVLRNWLKHHKQPEKIDVSQTDVVTAILRASSKYMAVYSSYTPEMDAFFDWCRKNGYMPASD